MKTLGGPVWSLALVISLSFVLTACFEQEEPTCQYWVPKLTTATQGEKALAMVEELGCANALTTMDKMFQDRQFRERILHAVKQIGDRGRSVPILKKAIVSRDTSKLACSIVEDWSLSAAKPELLELLTGPGLPKHRPEALNALLSFEKPAAIEDLLIELASGDPNIQGMATNQLAVQSLATIGSAKAVPALVKAAFMKTPRGESIYRVARGALAASGSASVQALLDAAGGKDEALNAYVESAGLSDWQWRTGPELAQLLTDTLDPRAAVILASGLGRPLVSPPGVSPMAKEKWSIAQRNRLKLSMLGLGHIGSENVVGALEAVVNDLDADAINQRLGAATSLALIGTPSAQKALLKAFMPSDNDPYFNAPYMQPLLLGLDHAHLSTFEKQLTKVTKWATRYEKAKGQKLGIVDRLADPRIVAYRKVLVECKEDPGCYVQRLESENSDEAVKAAVMLMRGLGDPAMARAALLKTFTNAPLTALDLRRFVLMALTRVGDADTGTQLVELAPDVSARTIWPDELRAFGLYMQAGAR